MGAMFGRPAASSVTTIPSRTSSSEDISLGRSKGDGTGWNRQGLGDGRTFVFHTMGLGIDLHARQAQKIGENLIAAAGEDGFGVELDAKHGPIAMLQRHDDAVVGAGGDVQVGGARFFFDDERMVAADCQWTGHVEENSVAIVVNGARSPVHRLRRTAQLTTKGSRKCLVTHTNTAPR